MFQLLAGIISFLAGFRITIGKHLHSVPANTIILFPYAANTCQCGITGIVAVKTDEARGMDYSMPPVAEMMQRIAQTSNALDQADQPAIGIDYLGGEELIENFYAAVRSLKTRMPFYHIFSQPEEKTKLSGISEQLGRIIDTEGKRLSRLMGRLSPDVVETMSRRIERLKDTGWCLKTEIIDNIEKITALNGSSHAPPSAETITTLKNINAVLNSIDRLEVRGRDSAGISLLFFMTPSVYENLKQQLGTAGLLADLNYRQTFHILTNQAISINEGHREKADEPVSLAITYKVAAEIGGLGENISFIRRQITADPILKQVLQQPFLYHTVSAHTRWASVGAINEANCHPVDNRTLSESPDAAGIIHICLNGDIDNYQTIKAGYAARGIQIPSEISCDTKIIPVHIQHYLSHGHPIETAFRLAVNDFEGSHAISMHTDLAPGKLFLALKGSGQAIFVGLAADHYIPSSEIYGIVEETADYLKLDGGTPRYDAYGNPVYGQIFVIDQASAGKLDGVQAMYYDGTPIALSADDIHQTPLTSRDIDRQHFNHYFLKEISESPVSVRKTLENRWKIIEDGGSRYVLTLDESMVPAALVSALKAETIRRILFIGQGTAGVAAQACADIMRFYLNNPTIQVDALKSSELSGFITETDHLNETLVIPISQSGTTTDTNRTVDMMKQLGAWAIAIVNRRDSDLTFKVDGVVYTSSGRDIEMSVASTKAFYSQIIAGALLGLYFTQLTERRNDAFISQEIKQMLEIPEKMAAVLASRDRIQSSARRLAVQRTYWAAVGSGPNKSAADEIRIKLSELCYKTISSDYVEDKKHIDLSSEPLIFVCAAGTRRSVIGDIIKDTAIFRSHKALPVVIADEHEDRFDPYASDVIHVPSVSEHFAPILNTLVGHIWGYYAALTINEGSRFLYDFREDLHETIDRLTEADMDIFEIALEKSFREKIIQFYREFRKKQANNELPSPLGIKGATNLTLLLKYLAGRLPLSDFEIDFGVKGTAKNMFEKLFESLGEAINCLARPVDAIKHQAKTVTVGTSRIEEKAEGLLFDVLGAHGFGIAQLSISNIMVLRNLQRIIEDIKGLTLYQVSGINLLGEPTDETRIQIVKKEGSSSTIPSRSETDQTLKGTKKIIVRQGNVYIGKGRKDDRSILIIPIISTDPNRPNTIEHLMLLEIDFKAQVDLPTKVKALGGKHEHIKNLVQENNIQWEDQFLELIDMPELFGRSAEKVSEMIVSRLS
jgi:glucosamine--fructose-6-phosphate aminotransferase (isomerizing)